MLRAVRDAAATIATLGLLLAVTVTVGVSAQPPAVTPPARDTACRDAAARTDAYDAGLPVPRRPRRARPPRRRWTRRPVTDLTAADVEVRENGVLQRVEDLIRVSLPLPAAASTRPPAGAGDVATNYGAADARVYVLVLDDLHIDGAAHARYAPDRPRAIRRSRRRGRRIRPRSSMPAAAPTPRSRSPRAAPVSTRRSIASSAASCARRRSSGRRSTTSSSAAIAAVRGRRTCATRRIRSAPPTRGPRCRTLASATTMLGRIEGRRKAVTHRQRGLDYDISGLVEPDRVAPPAGCR